MCIYVCVCAFLKWVAREIKHSYRLVYCFRLLVNVSSFHRVHEFVYARLANFNTMLKIVFRK